MKKTITITCTAIAVTITTPNTPPRAATATDDDDPLLSHAGTVLTNDKNPVRPIDSYHWAIKRINWLYIIMLTRNLSGSFPLHTLTGNMF